MIDYGGLFLKNQGLFVCGTQGNERHNAPIFSATYGWNPTTHYNHSHPIKVTAYASNTLISRPFYLSHFWQFARKNHLFLLAAWEEHFLENKYIRFCPIFIDGAQKSVSICCC